MPFHFFAQLDEKIDTTSLKAPSKKINEREFSKNVKLRLLVIPEKTDLLKVKLCSRAMSEAVTTNKEPSKLIQRL